MPTMNDIQAEIRNVLESMECADVNEVDENVLDAYLDELASQESDKVDAYGFVLRQQSARVQFLKDEEKRVNARRKAAENALERMKGHLLHVMQSSGLRKVSGSTTTISIRTTRSVKVSVGAEQLPNEFVRVKTTYEADKSAIKAAIDAGIVIDGCSIEDGEFLQVK